MKIITRPRVDNCTKSLYFHFLYFINPFNTRGNIKLKLSPIIKEINPFNTRGHAQIKPTFKMSGVAFRELTYRVLLS